MKRLGLVVIRPQRGDTFQNDVHTLTTTSSETINVPEFAKIDQCITPACWRSAQICASAR